MPRGDGTGPMGTGPLGAGCRQGMGRGCGKGSPWSKRQAGFISPAPLPFYANPAKTVNEMEALLDQSKQLAEALNAVNQRIAQLDKKQ